MSYAALSTPAAQDEEAAPVADYDPMDLEERIANEPEPLGETIFAMASACMIHDYVWLFKGTGAPALRVSRMIFSTMLVLACLAFQMFLLQAVYGLLCASSVIKIRGVYSSYELTMYGENHVEKNEDDHYRGTAHQYLDVSNFDKFDIDKKHDICQIPLAHPEYSFAILLIWTLTCFADLKKTLQHLQGLTLMTPTAASVFEVLEKGEGGAVIVAKLTMPMKIIISLFCLIPRFFSVGLLNFLGCRWLLATNSLSDILLNALALEFMLVLKELLYATLGSRRNKFITENTLFIHPSAGRFSLTGVVGSAAMWATLSVVWVYLYIYHVQAVLPDYRWGIQKVCATWKGAVHMR